METSENMGFLDLKESIAKVPNDNPYKNLISSTFQGIQQFELSKKTTNQVRILTDLESGYVEADVLSKMIQGLQSIVDGAYNFVFGNGSSSGKIPNRYSLQSKLIINAFAKGSFIIKFDTKESIDSIKDINLLETDDKVNELLDDVLVSLNELSSYDEVQSFIEKYGLRTFNRSREWIKSIKDVSFEYKNKNGKNMIEFRDSQVKDIANLMSKINIKVEKRDIDLLGKLIVINSKTSKITFETDQKEIIVRVQDNSIEKLHLVLNETYNIRVQEIVMADNYNRLNREYVVHTLYKTSLDKENR
ncbi:hypothetical protein [Enterococcus pseudoavium]|uniref:hypothetical protein n=1 Tax=Enterococcus pseudoavium TaxID=44007 RepID=UPI003F9A71CD